MGSMERLHLRWNDFESNIKLGFSELREDEDFYDVTLACESKQIKAHKVILSACSPFFRYLIKSVSHAHPLLYLRGIKFDHLEALLSFMYNGEVSVSQEELSSFLSLGEELQIKGLNKGGLSKPPPPEPHFVASESDEQTPEDNGTSPVMVDPIVVDGEFGMNDDLSEGDKELQDYSEVVNEDSGEVSVTHDELRSFLSLGKKLQIKALDKGGPPQDEPPAQLHFMASVSEKETPKDNAPPPVMADTIMVDCEIEMNEGTSEGDKELQDCSEVETEDNYSSQDPSMEHEDSEELSLPVTSAPHHINIDGDIVDTLSEYGDRARLVKSTRGKDVLVDCMGYTYNQNSFNKSNGRRYWVCKMQGIKCYVRIHTKGYDDQIRILKILGTHSHLPCNKYSLKRRVIEKIRELADQKPEASHKNIVKEVISTLDEESRTNLPDVGLLERGLLRWKRIKKRGVEEILP